ncbi:MAG: EF-hand domain-containing protein [Smithellaceae bacterium]|nr:EF-hand domain-containing protein [Syntrophaceae bacterium]MDD4242069.1 EF-hand domain-containing protein [Smithellaceae bacterium]NLX53193.1 EF-hand domain-containing protein [Deltaproteobacteria bacterium]
MMVAKKILLILALLFVAAWSAAAAEKALPKLDQNNDGKVVEEEYLDAVARAFDGYDKNSDGVLTRNELPAMKKADADRLFQEVDADRDGGLLKKEFARAAKKRFSTLDKNKNGFIDPSEWASSRSELYSPFTLFTF